jgi:hypothetical protein
LRCDDRGRAVDQALLLRPLPHPRPSSAAQGSGGRLAMPPIDLTDDELAAVIAALKEKPDLI